MVNIVWLISKSLSLYEKVSSQEEIFFVAMVMDGNET